MRTIKLAVICILGTVLGYYDGDSPECLSREEYSEMKIKQLPPWEAC